MPTRTETQSIELAAAPDAVVAVLADAHRLPEWAPGFADSVQGDAASGWLVTKDGQQFAIRVAVSPAAGTVDFLREVAPGREGGAYLRALPGPGGGSVLVMTLPILPGTDLAQTAEILRGELEALRALLGG